MSEAFVATWTEEPIPGSVPASEASQTLDESGARELLANDRPLRSTLGLR